MWLSHNDEEAIRETLMGHSVTVIDEDKLQLDDGTVLTIVGNEGCGGCTMGWYEVTALDDCPNIITNVVFNDLDDELYQIFVYAQHKMLHLLTAEGEDNGYYGTGYWINVKRVAGL